MPRVALMVPNFTEPDAVSTDVSGMYRTLSKRGHEVRIFASHWETKDLPVQHISAVGRFLADPSTIAIYHLAAGWQEGTAALTGARCKRVLKYHNVTPAEFFEGIDQEFVLSCRAGRQELAVLARSGLDGYLADSDFNLQELLDLGAPPEAGAVVPPFHNIQRLLELTPDAQVLASYREAKATFLVVGRLAPNKGHVTLLETFALYQRAYEGASRLVVVGKGDDRLAAYTKALRAHAKGLGVEDAVVFTGAVSPAALKAYYEAAAAFVITSRHEGFCVPLVEAMALGTPVLALGTTAVPGTVGGAGLVWEECDHGLLAESMHRLAMDRTVAVALGERGRQRYREHFTNERIERSLCRALEGLCGLDRI